MPKRPLHNSITSKDSNRHFGNWGIQYAVRLGEHSRTAQNAEIRRSTYSALQPVDMTTAIFAMSKFLSSSVPETRGRSQM
jgi:hypothetical protein